MKKTKIGAITIGQSPRVDVTPDMFTIFSSNIELIECGAIDEYSYDETKDLFYPTEDDTVLVSRMRDGRQVYLAEEKILPLLQKSIEKLEKQQCEAIIMLCTGNFPEFKHRIPLIKPRQLLQSITQALVGNGPIGLLVPDEQQILTIKQWWDEKNISTELVAASPYGDLAAIKEAAHQFVDSDVKLIFMDCIGYSLAMKELVKEITSLPVLLPRTMVARVISEMY